MSREVAELRVFSLSLSFAFKMPMNHLSNYSDLSSWKYISFKHVSIFWKCIEAFKDVLAYKQLIMINK